MSNLKAASAAIQAEIAHVKSGIEYYLARVAVLEQALASLGSLDKEAAATEPAGAAKTRLPRKARTAQAKASSKTRKNEKSKRVNAAPSAEATAASALPFTGGDFWPSLITDQPQAAPEILKAAIARLGFTPTKEQAKQLAARQTFALRALVQQKKIQDSGAGRDRRFFAK